MARCSDCYQEISFVLLGTHTNGRNIWSLPQEKVEHSVVQEQAEDGQVVGYTVVDRFVLHDCAEGRARAEKERAEHEQREIEKAQRRKAEQKVYAMEEDPEVRYARHMLKECPRCGAAVGVKCYNLHDPTRFKVSAHEERW